MKNCIRTNNVVGMWAQTGNVRWGIWVHILDMKQNTNKTLTNKKWKINNKTNVGPANERCFWC